MSTYCYLCMLDGQPTEIGYYVCNSCGGVFCNAHGGRSSHSKNAWCIDCVPSQTARAAAATAGGLHILRDKDPDNRSPLAKKLALYFIGKNYVVSDLNSIVAFLDDLADLMNEST